MLPFRSSTAIMAVAVLLPFSAIAQSNIQLSSSGIVFHAERTGARFSIDSNGNKTVAASPAAGILINGSPLTLTDSCTASPCTLHGKTSAGGLATLSIRIEPHHVAMTVHPAHEGAEVRFITAGASPAYGLADHAAEQKQFSTLENKQFNTDVTGFKDDIFLSGQGLTRLVSNFIIYPKQGFAEVLIDPYRKIVHTSGSEIVQGVEHAHGDVRMHYFFGDPHAIYGAYLAARNAAGYRVMVPKYAAFGVGWEAFGALGWDTNQKTDTESIDHYLKDGFPLRWIVVGSGFWPSQPESMHETTSFGYWDKEKYPDPRGMFQHFKEEGLVSMLGLRITFITTGPYSDEGVKHGYFLKDASGKAESFTGGWPKMPYYLLDAHNPAALDWYMGLVKKWQDYGVSGWKEDFYGYGKYPLRDDKVDPTNDRLMAQNQLIIERNGYLSSNGDLHRINDFNYNQDQDRGPVNALALAYAGFPLVYPDIVGGTFGESHFNTQRTPQMETYMMRNAMWASLHSSMGMGEPPWSFRPGVANVMRKAAQLHDRISPYLFQYGRRFAADGYPWTMTPLPIAYPNDSAVYAHENATDHRYEWLIGEALLAAPLYGNDYATATTRDIYLPAGEWMDFETGTLYNGNQLLRAFALPVDKIPLFVGGTGITLEKQNKDIFACIYPVARKGSTTLSLPDDPRPIRVTVAAPLKGARNIVVKDRSGKEVAISKAGFGYSFHPVAGESYTVTTR
ncbi:TIM-barrel domain-containing protein [Terriglobus sp. TAA 43]|uniref:TIM-barrel domain-containing protein n=1 Tax=Terriglobus sp. TAA 43 TaxID=278961 RepID=UPI0018DBE261|nr:TIM-barrel domain-containing protein [Terriglobus sp. TAA 43]